MLPAPGPHPGGAHPGALLAQFPMSRVQAERHRVDAQRQADQGLALGPAAGVRADPGLEGQIGDAQRCDRHRLHGQAAPGPVEFDHDMVEPVKGRVAKEGLGPTGGAPRLGHDAGSGMKTRKAELRNGNWPVTSTLQYQADSSPVAMTW